MQTQNPPKPNKNRLLRIFGNKHPHVFNRFNYKALGAPDLNVRYAKLGIRFIAFIVDVIVVFTLLTIINEIFKAYIPDYSSNKIPAFIVAGVTWFLYKSLLECSIYQATVGKMIVKLKVIDLYGKRLSFLRASARCISAIFSILPVGLGIWYITTDSKRQSWHDLISGTYVIKV